jgi:AcrR family transcriptional regulator
MQDIAIAITSPQAYGKLFRSTYHHRNVPAALRKVARQMLEAGNPEDVGLRAISRRIGVSATAAYRYFSGRDDLMASVAVEGFHELTAALEAAAAAGPDPMVAVGLAYLEFALCKRGMFRLMFGPLLAQRSKYPGLHTAADAAFGVIERAGLSGDPEDHKDTAGLAAWGLIHGLSALFIENLVPTPDARQLAQQVFAGASHVVANTAPTV